MPSNVGRLNASRLLWMKNKKKLDWKNIVLARLKSISQSKWQFETKRFDVLYSKCDWNSLELLHIEWEIKSPTSRKTIKNLFPKWSHRACINYKSEENTTHAGAWKGNEWKIFKKWLWISFGLRRRRRWEKKKQRRREGAVCKAHNSINRHIFGNIFTYMWAHMFPNTHHPYTWNRKCHFKSHNK